MGTTLIAARGLDPGCSKLWYNSHRDETHNKTFRGSQTKTDRNIILQSLRFEVGGACNQNTLHMGSKHLLVRLPLFHVLYQRAHDYLMRITWKMSPRPRLPIFSILAPPTDVQAQGHLRTHARVTLIIMTAPGYPELLAP